jgi:hypothetical protein
METFVNQLSQLKHRKSGTRENEEGVRIIRDIFDSFGWKTRIESFHVPGPFAYGFTVNIIALLAVYFSLRDHYFLSLILYGFAALSFYGELMLSFHLLRRLHPTHNACNVEARWKKEEETLPLVIVMAHHDTPGTGILYSERTTRGFAPLVRKMPPPLNRLFFLPFFAALLLGAALALRPVTAAAALVNVLSVLSVAILAATLFLVIEWGLSTPSPGANDNSSGVLVLLELARRFSAHPPHTVAVRLLATGAEETGFFGHKNYLRHHKKELIERDTLFINIESIGGGDLHWAISEAFLGKVNYPEKSLELLARSEKEGAIPILPRIHLMAPTDGMPTARAGLSVLTMVGLENQAVPSRYHRISDTFDKLDRENLSNTADIIERMIRRF